MDRHIERERERERESMNQVLFSLLAQDYESDFIDRQGITDVEGNLLNLFHFILFFIYYAITLKFFDFIRIEENGNKR